MDKLNMQIANWTHMPAIVCVSLQLLLIHYHTYIDISTFCWQRGLKQIGNKVTTYLFSALAYLFISSLKWMLHEILCLVKDWIDSRKRKGWRNSDKILWGTIQNIIISLLIKIIVFCPWSYFRSFFTFSNYNK